MPDLSTAQWLVLSGLLCGLLLGAAARAVRFCTFGAIEDVVMTGNTVRLRTWFFAMAVAIFTTQIAAFFGWVSLQDSSYLQPLFRWGAVIIGSLMFGFGMALAGNCGYGSIIRMASGDLRAFTNTIVMGIAAYVTARGILNPVRQVLIEPLSTSFPTREVASLSEWASAATGAPTLFFAMLVALLFAGWCFASPSFRHSKGDIAIASIVGGTVCLGFVLTSQIAQKSFEPVAVESMSYALPPGETLVYLMTYTGAKMDFAVAAIIGTIIGAALMAAFKREFHLEGFDEPRDMRRQMFGACLMGIGGVLAGGCTVGLGISGMATLSNSAPLGVAGIIIGAAFGVQYLIGGRALDMLATLVRLDLGSRD
jgi:uncharacterized protein